MWLADISIKRPVLATVMSLVLLLFGVVGWLNLSVREYPDVDPPIVSVSTLYTGANAEVMESTVTERLEDELIGIEGIKAMASTSSDEVSNIIIEFNLTRDVNVAAQDVRDRVARARGSLPDDIEEPIISKQDSDAQAIMWLSLYGKNFSQLQITDFADRVIVDQLQVVPGVGQVIIGGAREYSMRLWLDPIKMANRRVTVLDVDSALKKENVEIPSGRVEGMMREFAVRTEGELKTPEEFDRLIIKRVNGQPVYLADIGTAKIGARSDRSLVRFNGQPAVGLGIVKQSKANTLEVAHGVKAKLPFIQSQLPKGMNIELAFDSSQFIEHSISEVVESLYLAFVLVVGVVYLFLRSPRATIIPTISIPVSVIASFAVMYFLGYSINIVTLLGLTLAIGLVVDDSIVVLENIYRRMELGESAMEASFKGIREIAFAVVATTIVLVAVFVPITFAQGVTARLLSEFAIVVACSVLISMFVSLTLTPMLCSRFLKISHASDPERRKSGNPVAGFFQTFGDMFERLFDWIANGYAGLLDKALSARFAILGCVAVFILVTGGMFFIMPKEFLPLDDQSSVMSFIASPEGSTMAYTDRAVRKAEAIFSKTPGVRSMFSVIALSQAGPGKVNNGLMFVRLQDPQDRALKQQEIVQQLFPQMLGIPEAFVFPINPPSGPNAGLTKPVEMVIQGYDIKTLAVVAEKIKDRSEKEVLGFIQGDTDLKLDKPQLNIEVDRERASRLGVSVADASRTLGILLGGLDLSTFKLNNKRYDVMVQAFPEMRRTPEQLNQIYVRGKGTGDDDDSGALIPITNVVRFQETVSSPELNHYNRLRAATISGSLAPIPGVTLGTVLDKMQKIAREEMTQDMSIQWKGQSKEYFDASQAIYLAFGLALVVVYLTLSAQFESFIDPIIVMLTVPLAICGAILSLFALSQIPVIFGFIPFIHKMIYTSYSINIYSQIGMIMLIGLVTKNGILIVEFANQVWEHHPAYTARQAVVEAAKIRFRPILMTTLAMIMGSVPIAVGLGSGIDSRKSLGVVIVGGLILSTMLTLFVIPIAYDLIKSKRRPA